MRDLQARLGFLVTLHFPGNVKCTPSTTLDNFFSPAISPMAGFANSNNDLTRKRMEPAGSGTTWTGSPKGVFAGRKHHKPRQGVMANPLKLHRNGAVGFIDWLDILCVLEEREKTSF